MQYRQFHSDQRRFVNAFRAILSESRNDKRIVDAAYPAYSDKSGLVRFLFWRRIWLTVAFLELQAPYDSVLDFGCGSGVLLSFLTEYANRIIGLDIDITPYRALAKNISFSSKIDVYETGEYPLSSFPDKTFDVITALDVLEHVKDLRGVLSEFCRISKPGGIIVVCGPTENIFYRFGRIIAGKQYTGDYHVTNINTIRNVMDSFMETKILATLYYPFPLFKIICGIPS